MPIPESATHASEKGGEENQGIDNVTWTANRHEDREVDGWSLGKILACFRRDCILIRHDHSVESYSVVPAISRIALLAKSQKGS
ncbi:hypothetical protein FPCIR_4595 [Fusarium pseudocircinatum]|uniref:Uncharacterized protein n=1 Tax=Fusarium pseudocircinatum TaxID=56676 RepID=A0A8H5PDT4_9HYPO|nr:hypothetical protein FPCIR_4595 [Fusarium pseudocircinatum]